jgi:hypothetical protein
MNTLLRDEDHGTLTISPNVAHVLVLLPSPELRGYVLMRALATHNREHPGSVSITRKTIAKTLRISLTTAERLIPNLCAWELIRRQGPGLYTIRPLTQDLLDALAEMFATPANNNGQARIQR